MKSADGRTARLDWTRGASRRSRRRRRRRRGRIAPVPLTIIALVAAARRRN